jgi:acyl carrier protein
MEIKDFVEKFAELFDDTDASEIKAETVFRDIEEWSSLIALSVIAMVDEEYDVALNGDNIKNSHTVADLFSTVKKKLS